MDVYKNHWKRRKSSYKSRWHRIMSNNIFIYLVYKGIITDYETVWEIPTFQRSKIVEMLIDKRKKVESATLAKAVLDELIKQDVITGFICVEDIPNFVVDDLSKIIENKIGELGLID